MVKSSKLHSMVINLIINRRIKLVYIIILFVFVGCSQIQVPFFGKSTEQSNNVVTSDHNDHQAIESNTFVVKGSVINAKRLQQGKNIAIIPFKAGVNVEATYKLDRTALMIVKGISDAFDEDKNGKHAHFNILTADDSDNADLIVRGHITKMGELSKLRRWVLLKRKKMLSVDGKIFDVQTGEAVLTFDDYTDTSAKSEDYTDLGYRIGNNIGQYILSSID